MYDILFQDMAFRIPPRTTETNEVSFHTISGPWHKQLSELLKNLGVRESPRVRVIGHYDGNILMKYGVELRMPRSLGLRVPRFEIEARHQHVAYRMVMVNAIISIRS